MDSTTRVCFHALEENSVVQAIRVHHFDGLDALVAEDVPRPVPGDNEVLLRVKAAGVGPWDAWIRSGRSVVSQPLPLTLGSDVSGIVEQVGAGVPQFNAGDAVFGATNARFTGGYAEYAVASATKLAHMARRMGFIAAASVPVFACTAWQMVFEHGAVDATMRVLVHGGAGNVGANAVQLAKRVAREVVTTALSDDIASVQTLGADQVIDARRSCATRTSPPAPGPSCGRAGDPGTARTGRLLSSDLTEVTDSRLSIVQEEVFGPGAHDAGIRHGG
jgi:NADPH:quinone reductase-like Zn-dependent oxidoreductase